MKNSERRLSPKENGRTKKLYEKIFSEDSPEFIEFYYRYKATENKIYVVEDEEGETLSMLHLNPYQIRLAEENVCGQYIVAVATDERYRHQGMMRRLLKAAVAERKRQGDPFIFLMPAAEAIYSPFDFRYIYSQAQCNLRTGEYLNHPRLLCRPADEKILDGLVVFAEQHLRKHYRVYALHTKAYFRTLMKEQSVQNGQVVVILREGRICGYFMTAVDGAEAEVREAVIEDGYEEFLPGTVAGYLEQFATVKLYGFLEKAIKADIRKPMIMARAVNIMSFAQCLRAKERVNLVLELTDTLLPENTGIYEFTVDSVGGTLKPAKAEKEMFSLGIGDFTALAFGYVTAKELEASPYIQEEWEKIDTLQPVFLNEVV